MIIFAIIQYKEGVIILGFTLKHLILFGIFCIIVTYFFIDVYEIGNQLIDFINNLF